MRKLSGLFALLVLFSLPALAQDEGSRVEVGGGYTFRSFLPPTPGAGLPNPRVNFNGWNATVSYRATNWLTVATDVDGTYNSTPDVSGGSDQSSIYTVLAGPRVYPLGHHKLAPYGHVMFGLAHIRATLSSASDCGSFCTATDGSFAIQVGGGVDLNLSRHLAIRAAEFDYERTSFLDLSTPGLSDGSNNFKVKAGILFRF